MLFQTGAAYTPLMEACTQGHYEIICALINGRADATLQNEHGFFASDYLEEFIKLNSDEAGPDVIRQLKEVLRWLREKEALLSMFYCSFLFESFCNPSLPKP